MKRDILRIVRLSFKEDKIDDFINIFNTHHSLIEGFSGCFSVKLKRDFYQPNIFYTVSEWESQEALDQYRKSELFVSTWDKTKVLFNDKPQAYSLTDVKKL